MFTSPEKNVSEFGFLPGQSVADFGAGSGHYVLALSRLLGPNGHIYAVDISPHALTHIKEKAEEENRLNVDVVLGDVDDLSGSGLATESLDGVLLSNILFQLEKPGESAKEVGRVLKPGGRACVIDWNDKFPPKKTEEIFSQAGFAPERKLVVGDSHYGLIFVKL